MVVLRPVLPPPIQPFSSTATLREAVLAGEVVGGAEPVAAAADDQRVVGGLGLGAAPLRRPAALPAQPLQQKRKT